MWRCQQLRWVAALPGVRGAHTKITNPLSFPDTAQAFSQKRWLSCLPFVEGQPRQDTLRTP